MKTKFVYLFILSVILFSCQKEYSVESGFTNTAEFTFDGAPAACNQPIINGTYMAGIALSAANTVTVAVTVAKVGSYNIVTNTTGGISFNGKGTFTALGTQTIVLTGSGTPAASGAYSFTPGTTGCSFAITVAAAASPATFTYTSVSGVCTAPLINGTYTTGTALTSTNTITLGVNVTAGGSYSVNTNSANGVTFSGSGLLAAGAQIIILTSTNTPTAAGTFNYTPSGGCSFPVIYAPAGGGTGTNFLKCKIDGVLTNFNTGLQAINIPPPAGFPLNISIQGKISDIAGGVQELWVAVQDPTSVNTGAYANVTFGTILDRGCVVGYYPTGFPNIYFGGSAISSNTFTVNITLRTATRIEGNFAGTLYDQNGSSLTVKKIIDSGSFSVGF
jgi:hypothetical protein